MWRQEGVHGVMDDGLGLGGVAAGARRRIQAPEEDRGRQPWRFETRLQTDFVIILALSNGF